MMTGGGFLKHGPLGLVSVLWAVVNVILFSSKGVKIVDDSARYIEYANGLSSGFYFDSHNFWYIGYAIYLLIIFKVFSGSMVAVVVGQYVLSLVAVLALYRTAFLLWSSIISALATCVLFLAFIDISLWNSYILTESLYTSFTCFSLYFLVKCYKQGSNVVLASIAVVVTFFIKPTGIAILVAVMSVLIYNTLRNVSSIFVRGLILLGVSLVLIALVNRMITTYLILENYQLGEIIYGVRAYHGEYPVSALMIDPPGDLYIPDQAQQPVIRVLSFVVHNPIYWTKLFALKVFYLLSHTRPFWSVIHNLFSVTILLPSYFLFFKSLRSANEKTVIVFSIAFLLVHILSVGITSEDWDGRFLVPMLPVLFIIAPRSLQRTPIDIRNGESPAGDSR